MKSMTRFVGWRNSYECKSGKHRHHICVLSVDDLQDVVKQREFIVNKFMLEFDPIAYQCMEEFYEDRVRNQAKIDMNFYCGFMKPRSSMADCNLIYQ